MTHASPNPPKFPFDPSRLIWVPQRKPPKISDFGEPLAGFNRRMIAATLDTFLLFLIVAPVSNYIAHLLYGHLQVDWEAFQAAQQLALTPDALKAERMRILSEGGFFERWTFEFMLQTSIMATYSFLCWHYWGATLGKLVVRIRIVNARTGRPITDTQAVFRLLGYAFSTLPLLLGFFWIGLDKRRQGWHGKLAGTVVVAVPWKKPSEVVGEVQEASGSAENPGVEPPEPSSAADKPS